MDLSNGLTEILGELGIDESKANAIVDNNKTYANAVVSIWKDPEASQLILNHTNAFYIREDDSPKKGVAKGSVYAVCEICSDDPLVRSELDTHRELLQFALRSNGLSFEELRIIPARRGMKKRHPFSRL